MTDFIPRMKMLLKQQCHLCLARFSTSGHLMRHKAAHGANRRYKCTGCDCSYARNDNLIKHFKNAHDNSNKDAEDKERSINQNLIILNNNFNNPFISAYDKLTDQISIKSENNESSPECLIEDDNTNDDDDDDICINTDTGWITVGSVDPCSIFPPGEAPYGCPEYTLLQDNDNASFIDIDSEGKKIYDYHCQFCSFGCTNEQDIKKHLITHIKTAEEKNRLLDSGDEMDVHEKIDDEDNDYSCNDDNVDEYNKGESDESDYIISDNTNSSKSKESSILASLLKFSNSSDMQCTKTPLNEFDSNKREILCEICGYKFIFIKDNDTNIKIEIYNSQNNDPCNECKSKCDKVNQNYNCNVIEEEQQELMGCSYCEYKCEDAKDLKKHMTSHNMLKCPYCIYTCTEAASLKNHILTHNISSNPMTFNTIVGAIFSSYEENILKCPYCEFQCIETRDLRVHIMMHTAEAVLRLTNKNSTQKNDFHTLKQHLTPKNNSKVIRKLHSKEHSFQWDQQMAKKSSFKNKSISLMENESEDNSTLWTKQISKQNTLNNSEHHLDDHDFQWIQQITPWAKSTSNYDLGKAEPSYQCPYCEFRFFKARDLKHHLKSHGEVHRAKRKFKNNETPCDLCGATFSSRGHMRRHKESHGANRTFKCRYCDCSYSRKDNLIKHISSAHSSNEDQAKGSATA